MFTFWGILYVLDGKTGNSLILQAWKHGATKKEKITQVKNISFIYRIFAVRQGIYRSQGVLKPTFWEQQRQKKPQAPNQLFPEHSVDFSCWFPLASKQRLIYIPYYRKLKGNMSLAYKQKLLYLYSSTDWSNNVVFLLMFTFFCLCVRGNPASKTH